jgi:hypothetical protein
MQDRGAQKEPCRAGERPPPCRHFVEEHAQRPHIRSWICRSAAELLRGHACKRSRNGAFSGDRLLRLRDVLQALRRQTTRKAEVQYFGAAVRGHHDVRRFQIPVQHAVAMRVGKRVRNLRPVSL